MIRSKKELYFYIAADRMINRGCFRKTLVAHIKEFFIQDYIMDYLVLMRKSSYYTRQGGVRHLLSMYYKYKYFKLGAKLGFSIGCDVFGYGLVIPHYGTIVVGGSNRIGNYAVLHTSTCISDNKKNIGDGLYLSTGAKMTSKIVLGNNVSVGANSVVNRSFGDNIMIAGAPAREIKDADAWYLRDGKKYSNRVKLIEELRESLCLQ